MFIDILRSAENSAKVTKEIITYKADGNGIKTVKKELLSLAEVYKDNSISGLYADATEPENNGIIIYKDFSPCLEVAKIWNDPTAEQMQKALSDYNAKVQNFDIYINNKINTGNFIKNTELKVIESHGDLDLLQRAKQAKMDFLQAREDQHKQEEAQREAERKAEQEAEKVAFEKLIADYEQKIINKEPFSNAEIEIPEGKETTIILYLCQKYGLNIPLKTQGWINSGLAGITWNETENGKKITYMYRRDSKVFYNYLQTLEKAIFEAYGLLTEEEKEEADKQKAEAEEEKSLYNSVEKIDFEAVTGSREEFDLHFLIKQSEPLTISKADAEGIYTRLYKAAGIKDYKQIQNKTNSNMILYTENSFIKVENYSNGIICSCRALKGKNGKSIYLFRKSSKKGNYKAIEDIA